MRWAGHVARTEEMRNVYRVLVGKLEGKRQLGRPRYRGGIILRWMFTKLNVGYRLDRVGTGQGQVTCTCESGNEISGSIKRGEFLDYLKSVSFSRTTLLHGVSK